MAISDFIGGVVRLLWKDIPYVGYFLEIDKDHNAILTDCMMYSNFLMCFYKTINYTNQHVNYVRLPVCKIKWIGSLRRTKDQIEEEIAGIKRANFKKLFYVTHCENCFKPREMIPIEEEESGAAFTLIGNMNYHPRGPKHILDYVTLLEGKTCTVCENGGNAGASEPLLWSQAEGRILKCVLTNPNYYNMLGNLPGQNHARMETSPDPFSNPTYTASFVPIPTEFKIKVGSTQYSLQYINGNLPRPLTEVAYNNCERATDINQDPTSGLPNYIANMENMDNDEDMVNDSRTSGFGNMEGFGSVGSFENMENVANMENHGYIESVGSMNNFGNPDNLGNMGRFGVIGIALNMGNSQNFGNSGYARRFENTRHFRNVENVDNIRGVETVSNFGIHENDENYENTENVRSVGNMEDYVNNINANYIRAIEHLEYNMRANRNRINIGNMDGNEGIGFQTHSIQPHYHTDHVTDFQREPSLSSYVNIINANYIRAIEHLEYNMRTNENGTNIGDIDSNGGIGFDNQNMQPHYHTEHVSDLQREPSLSSNLNMIGANYIRAIQHLEHNMRANANGINIENMDGNRGIGFYTLNRQPHYHTGHVSDFQREPSLSNTENLEWGFRRTRIPSSSYCPYHTSSLNGLCCPHALSNIYANQYL